ncbi:hypothetical protein, partial [Bacillus thuringiensis]|uniref:hypothetical protein n=1 Tax=Bacillus thuringiensis TaxID=1428 RepID=UPI0032203DFB
WYFFMVLLVISSQVGFSLHLEEEKKEIADTFLSMERFIQLKNNNLGRKLLRFQKGRLYM